VSVRVTIEKLIYGGDGLARLASPDEARAKAVFVPFVLRDEQVEARAVEEKPGFVRASLENVLVPSSQRAAPDCPYFQRCGGCHYQHTGYDNQLAIKREILRETLERTAKVKWEGEIHLHASPPWGYRNRTRMKVGFEPFSLGYYRHGSHELLEVESCPISSPLINRAIVAVWELGRRGAFAQHLFPEIEFFADHADRKLLIELLATETKSREKLEDLTRKLQSNVPELASTALFYQEPSSKKGRQRREAAPAQLVAVSRSEPFIYRAWKSDYQVSPGSFFQTNRFMTDRLVELVCAKERGTLALDLYAGVGLFSAALARSFERVEAVEVAPSSFGDLRHNVPSNVRSHRLTTAAYLKDATFPVAPDLIVVDPPRAGLGGEIVQKLATLAAKQVIYVSCDPATMARDLAVFLQAGYTPGEVHLVDLFPQTYHMESVVRLERR
jgi:23S rRNA (uracil1939-C5)-methyltransferase